MHTRLFLSFALTALLVVGCEETTCLTEADCATTRFCNAEGTCELLPLPDSGPPDTPEPPPPGTKCTTDNEVATCAGYACMIKPGDPDGECYTECTTKDECLETHDCNATTGACEEIPVVVDHIYVGIVSTVPSDSADDLNTTTPGPDIDAVELIRGTDSFFAEVIEDFTIGAGVVGNNYDAPEDALGPNDAILDPDTPGSCDIGNVTNHWVSLGDETGFLVVSFEDDAGDPLAIEAGDVIRVYELDNLICTDVTTDFLDTFDVYVGLETEGTSTPADFDIFLTSSMPSGGMTEATVSP